MAQGLPLSPPPASVGEYLTPVLCVLSASGPVLVPQSPNPGVTVEKTLDTRHSQYQTPSLPLLVQNCLISLDGCLRGLRDS